MLLRGKKSEILFVGYGILMVLAVVMSQILPVAGAPDMLSRGVFQYGSILSNQMSVPLSEEVFVPAGVFLMGCSADTAGDRGCALDAQPIHAVYLDAYMIDKTEVSNAQYAACEAAGACAPPISISSATRAHYYGNPVYANYPVLQMDWNRANAYCQWEGKRLPTEAEWEKAARGDDLRPYPWGFEEMTCDRANVGILCFDEKGIPRINYCVGDTAPVDSYPDYTSPYGALNMVGNAQEWVNDIYLKPYYHTSPYYNPQGAASTATNEHLIRGGPWSGILTHANTWVRADEADIYYAEFNGFRCARTVSTGTPTPTPVPIPTPTPLPENVASVDTAGGLAWLAYPGHLTVARIPENGVSAETSVTMTYEIRPDGQGKYQGLDHFFTISAATENSTIDVKPGALQMEMLLGYQNRGGIILDTLSLYRLESGVWVTDGVTVTERLGNSVGVMIDRPGVYGLLGETNRTYLPHITRNR
jgi:formylglycine-generating enzyme required for sulfatase activity